MPLTCETKVYSYEGRHYIYLRSALIKDSSFPFDIQEDTLQIRIDGKRLVVEKA